MRRTAKGAVVLALCGVAAFLWVQLSPSPQKQIRARLAKLQELLSFPASQGNVSILANSQKVGALFTPDAVIRIDAQDGPRGALEGRDSIVEAVIGAQRMVGGLDVAFLDVVVTLGDDERSAVVQATGKAREAGTNELWIQELRFEFIETEEGWLIASVRTVRTLTQRTTFHPQLFRAA